MGGRQEERRGRRMLSSRGRRMRWRSCAVGFYSFAAMSAVVLLLINCRATVEGHAGCSSHIDGDDPHDHSHDHSHYCRTSHGHDPYDHHRDSSSLAAGDDSQEPSDRGRSSGIESSITSHDRQNPFHVHDFAHGYRSLAQFPDEMDDYEDGDSKREEDDDHDNVDEELYPRGIGLWARAMASSLAVSFASLICLALLPFILAWGKGPSQRAVDLLAAFGVGAMLGDALLHQLPHAFGSGGHLHTQVDHRHGHEHTHAHSHTHAHVHSHSLSHGHSAAGAHAHSLADLSVGLSVLVGIFLFFVVEKIVRRTEELGVSSSHAHGHHHSHKRISQEPAELTDGSAEAKESGTVSDKAEGDDEGGLNGNKCEGEGEEEKGKKEGKARRKRKGKEEGGKGSRESCEKGTVEGIENDNGGSNAKSNSERGGGKAEKDDDNTASVETSGEVGLESPADDTRAIKEDDDESGAAKKVEETTVEKQPVCIRRRRKSGKTGSKTTEERLSGEEVPDRSPAKKDNSDAKDQHKKPKQVEVHEVEKHTQTSTGVSASPSMAVLGYLNLFSDGVHNFTDGMALASAFMHHGSVGGWSRMLFILAHELPQEVGDFGILLRAGFSVTKALTLNFLSALLAMAGTAVVLAFGANPESSSLIEGFTAGGFIYLSIAGVIPDLHVQGNDLKTSILQLMAMGAGVSIALAISLWE